MEDDKVLMDTQVKVNGIRVDLTLIDAALKEHTEVEQAATLLKSVGGEDLRLVSFIVRRAQSDCTAEALQRLVAATLPENMIPAILVFLDELPRTASGQVDRPALAGIDVLPFVNRALSVPSTPMERLIAKCWEEELKVKGISTGDDFFVLGGDSLQALQMIYRLQEALPAPLPLGMLFFQNPVLGSYAAELSELYQMDE